MSRLTICPPCEMGEHERHYHIVQHPPEGGVGGAVCDCEGECKDVTPEERWKRMGLNEQALAALRLYYKGVK